MSISLVARHGEAFGLNMSGRSYLFRLLDSLGADTLEWSSTEKYIKARTARDWAKTLRNGIESGRVKERLVADSLYQGGLRPEPFIVGGAAAVVEGSASWMFDAMDRHLAESFAKEGNVRERVGAPQVEAGTVHDIDAETREWILDVATFLNDSGGFHVV